MPRFTYRARNPQGAEMTGVKEAKDSFELARSLRADGYLLLSAKDEHEPSFGGIKIKLPKSFSFLSRVSRAEKIIFSKNLGVMIGAGMSLTRALDALARESRNKKFKAVIGDIVDQVREGRTFTEALARHPDVFPPIYSAVVSAGEKSGKLQESLGLLATQMQADYDLIRKVRGASIYPAIVLSAMIAIGVLMLIYVVPTLTSVFKELNVDLPISTQFIIGTSDLLLNHGILIGLVAFFVVALLFRARRLPQVKASMDWIVIHFPIIGGIAKKVNTARTARTLSSLISSGVQILEALDITTRVVQNHYYTAVLGEARAGIQKGETISKAFLRHEDLYPSLMGEMLTVGEETGESSHMLNEVAIFYEGQVADATRDLSTIVEPLLMVVIGAFVGFFAVSMIQPMYSISNAI